MPTSDYHQISDVLHVVQQLAPRSVLDVGVGFGKWGFLCREVLEVYAGRVRPEEWEARIDGIEIHEPYRTKVWDLVYNTVHIGDARALLPTLGRYDLVICCDVVEHFDKAEGLRLVESMMKVADAVIVTSPRGYQPQGDAYGNPHETHLSGWGREDFAPFPHRYKDIGFTFLAVVASDPAVLDRVRLLDPLEVLGVKRTARRLGAMVWRRAVRKLGPAGPK